MLICCLPVSHGGVLEHVQPPPPPPRSSAPIQPLIRSADGIKSLAGAPRFKKEANLAEVLKNLRSVV